MSELFVLNYELININTLYFSGSNLRTHRIKTSYVEFRSNPVGLPAIHLQFCSGITMLIYMALRVYLRTD